MFTFTCGDKFKVKDPDLFPDVFEASFILICLFGLQVVLGHIFYYVFNPFKSGDPSATGIISVLSIGIIISFVISYKNIGYREIVHFSQHSIVKTIGITIIPIIVTCVGFVIVESEANKIIQAVFPMTEYFKSTFARLANGTAVSILTISFVAPIIEELLFRGIFLKAFIEQYTIKKSILVSSLMFAIFHLNIYQFGVAFAFGIFSGWLFIKTCSLFPCILAHFTLNSLSILHLELQKKAVEVISYGEAPNINVLFIYALTGVTFLAIGIIVLFHIFQRHNFSSYY